MFKCLIFVVIWVLTLGLFDIKVVFHDGWSVELYGWPSALYRFFSKGTK